MPDKYDPRPVDVWGAAIVMLNLCAGGSLWAEARPGSSPLYDDLLRGWAKWNAKHSETDTISKDDYPCVSFFDKHIRPPALRRMLVDMLNPDPKRRVAIRDVHENRWLKIIECCQAQEYEEPKHGTEVAAKTPGLCRTKTFVKVVLHNHLPPKESMAHRFVRMPGPTDI